jgi:hypothetical protein
VSQPVAPPGFPLTRIALRVALIAAVVVALLIVATTSRYGVWWRLITFTYQANLLAALFYVWTLVSPRADARSGLRGAAVVYVVVAGLVWNLFLTGYSMGYTVANFLLHVVVPILAVVEWMLVGTRQQPVRWWQPLVWLLYPAGYLLAALLVLNHAGRRAPYYFLDPAAVGAGGVTLNICVLAAVFLGLGYALLALGRTRWFAGIDVR